MGALYVLVWGGSGQQKTRVIIYNHRIYHKPNDDCCDKQTALGTTVSIYERLHLEQSVTEEITR